MAKEWTEREEAILTEMSNSGHRYSEIAERLGRSIKGVEAKARQMRRRGDMPRKKRGQRSDSWSDEETQMLISMINDGYRTKAIAEKIGRGVPATQQRLKRLRDDGHVIERRRTNREKIELLRKRYGVRVGSMSEAMFGESATITNEVIEWMIRRVVEMGFTSMSEYLLDREIDRYYEEMVDG